MKVLGWVTGSIVFVTLVALPPKATPRPPLEAATASAGGGARAGSGDALARALDAAVWLGL